MSIITKETLAGLLNGREYRHEILPCEESIAKESGLVVVFGYSDDNLELRGAIYDELGCYNGGTFMVNERGVVMQPDDDEREVLEKFGVLKHVASGAKIEAVWDKDGYSWTYKTDIPHATFDIMEDGTKYCRGIVFAVADIAKAGGVL